MQHPTPKVALITGVTGQDGSCLAELVLEKGYIVHGLKRRASSFNTQRVDRIDQSQHIDNARLHLHCGDLSDTSNLIRIVQETQPDEIDNLGAQSHVAIMLAALGLIALNVGDGGAYLLGAQRRRRAAGVALCRTARSHRRGHAGGPRAAPSGRTGSLHAAVPPLLPAPAAPRTAQPRAQPNPRQRRQPASPMTSASAALRLAASSHQCAIQSSLSERPQRSGDIDLRSPGLCCGEPGVLPASSLNSRAGIRLAQASAVGRKQTWHR